jgi:hypothetical protein
LAYHRYFRFFLSLFFSTDRDAWRSDVERLTLIEYRRNERERVPWWKRLAGLAPNSPKSPLLSASKAA